MSNTMESVQLSFLSLVSENSGNAKANLKPKKTKKTKKKVDAKPEKKELTENPLNSLLPWLFPDEYQKEICRSYKGVKDHECQSYVVWDLDNEKNKIQHRLFNLTISDLKSLEYIHESLLIDHLEWIIDDPVDDFSFLPCFYSFALLEQVSPEHMEASTDKNIDVHISKHDAYDLVEQFLIEQRDNLAFRLKKMNKNIKSTISGGKLNKKKESIYLANLKQGYKNLEILTACINIYF